MQRSSLGKFSVATLALALAGVGCGSMGGDKGTSTAGSKVIDRQQHQDTSPDGSAIRTRSQVRETAAGTQIRETETQKREVIQPNTNDATQQGAAQPQQ